jgi:hypothetical protein
MLGGKKGMVKGNNAFMCQQKLAKAKSFFRNPLGQGLHMYFSVDEFK